MVLRWLAFAPHIIYFTMCQLSIDQRMFYSQACLNDLHCFVYQSVKFFVDVSLCELCLWFQPSPLHYIKPL